MILTAKTLVKRIARKLGYKITKISNPITPNLEGNDMNSGLQRFITTSSSVNTIIDVGAAAGTWTERAIPLFPKSNFLLVEPLVERKTELETLAKKHQNINLLFKALGKEKSMLPFSISSDLDGSGFYDTGDLREIPVIDLDTAIEDLKLPGPFLLKLDTHGFEVPILKGAKSVLLQTQLVIIEVYGFKISDKSLFFWEMITYMEQLGFRLFDIVDTMRRPKDKAFWQCDAFFIRKDHQIFSSDEYN